MAWAVREIRNWAEFRQIADDTASVATSTGLGYVFRGQSDMRWSLQPTLARLLNAKSGMNRIRAFEIEDMALKEFQAQAHLHLSVQVLSQTTDMLGWWTLMQHYRAPTRLLDWTACSNVAAYFAVEENWDTDGVIWVVKVSDLDRAMLKRCGPNVAMTVGSLNDIFNNPNGDDRLRIIRRNLNTERMIAQQAGFSVSNDPLADHAIVTDEAMSSTNSEAFYKLVIPRKLKPEFLWRLRTLNISPAALFPGLDGIALTVADLVRVMR